MTKKIAILILFLVIVLIPILYFRLYNPIMSVLTPRGLFLVNQEEMTSAYCSKQSLYKVPRRTPIATFKLCESAAFENMVYDQSTVTYKTNCGVWSLNLVNSEEKYETFEECSGIGSFEKIN